MYQLLKSNNHPFPTIVEVSSEFYPLYIRLGYEKEAEGTYKELEKIQLQMVQEYLKTIKTN
jgi:hypothetical protein